jgi:hypothetical protein
MCVWLSGGVGGGGGVWGGWLSGDNEMVRGMCVCGGGVGGGGGGGAGS